jgi:hypothetical protein
VSDTKTNQSSLFIQQEIIYIMLKFTSYFTSSLASLSATARYNNLLHSLGLCLHNNSRTNG